MVETQEKEEVKVEREKQWPCDACNVPSFFVVHKKEKKLQFCRHHFMKYEASLLGSGWQYEDHSSELVKKDAPVVTGPERKRRQKHEIRCRTANLSLTAMRNA